jgi:translation initiation factor 4G
VAAPPLQIGQMVSDDPEEEKKQKAFNGLLNKLTPDNFERILEKMFAIGITAPKTLKGLIDRVPICCLDCRL